MNTASVIDRLGEDRFRWILALALSVLLHIIVIGIGALIGEIVAGQSGNGGFIAFLILLVLGPFAATYAARI